MDNVVTREVVVDNVINEEVAFTTSRLADHLTKTCVVNSTQSKQNSIEGLQLDENGCIVSGKLSALIKRLLPGKDYYPEKSYVFTFLLNARLFVSPAELLHKILQLFIFEQNAKNENFQKESRTKLFYNLMKLMSDWCDIFPYDFRSDQVKCRLKELLDLCCSADPTLNAFRYNLQQNLSNKIAKLDRYDKEVSSIQCIIRIASIELSSISTGLIEKCSNPKHFAQQLTLIELERLTVIGPEEFVYAFALDRFSNDTCLSPDLIGTKCKTATNIEHYINWCNHLSYFVATEICRHLKKKHRVTVIEFFIEVAKECINMGNFNSLVAIASAINMNPVARLKKTWIHVNKSKWKILEHQTDPVGNFVSYRSTLKAALWRSNCATNSSEKIVIPAFCVLFRDLFSLYDSCKAPLPNGHLNFHMFNEFAQHLTCFLQCKNVECPFDKNEDLVNFVLSRELFNDKCLQLASYECEAPDSVLEKELHKRLKLEIVCTHENRNL